MTHNVQSQIISLALVFALTTAAAVASHAQESYAWQHGTQSAAPQSHSAQTLASLVPPPDGFERLPAAAGTWASWLRGLPMKPEGSPVLLYTGTHKWRQDVHTAVVDIDTGTRDLQQCADAIMRLRAEWLYAVKRTPRITFNNTNGKPMIFRRGKSASYRAFRKYMIRVFAYAGTYSLEKELKSKPIEHVAIGDVFIKGGFPGHAVLVADMVSNPKTGKRKFLLL